MCVTRVELKDLYGYIELIQTTWDEVDQRKAFGMHLDVDLLAYRELEKQGSLFAYLLNDAKGFAVFLLLPDFHRKGKLKAISDVVYLSKEARGNFKDCLEVIKQDVKEAGADYISLTLKTRDSDNVYGMKLFEKTYQEKL